MKQAKIAVGEMLKLEPDFREKKEKLIESYIKVDTLVKKLINGLEKAG